MLEISTSTWDADRLLRVTDGIAGRQWGAYLTLVWSETRLDGLGPEIAHRLGRVLLLAGDITDGDARYSSLPPRDRLRCLELAFDSMRTLEALGLAFTRPLVDGARPVLARALEESSAADGISPKSPGHGRR